MNFLPTSTYSVHASGIDDAWPDPDPRIPKCTLSPEPQTLPPEWKASVAFPELNALDNLSKDNIIDLFEKLSCSSAPYSFFNALSNLSATNFNIVIHSSLFPYTIQCQLQDLLERGVNMSSFLANFSVVQQGYLLSSAANVTDEDIHYICYPDVAYFSAPDYALPNIDFSAYLQMLLLNATSTQMKEIPLTEYSSDVLAKAIDGLPQVKRNDVLNLLPPDRRSAVESVLT